MRSMTVPFPADSRGYLPRMLTKITRAEVRKTITFLCTQGTSFQLREQFTLLLPNDLCIHCCLPLPCAGTLTMLREHNLGLLALCNLSLLSSGSCLCSLSYPQLLSRSLCLSLVTLILCLLTGYPCLLMSHNSGTLPLELLKIPLVGSFIGVIIFKRSNSGDRIFLNGLHLVVSSHGSG